MILSAKDVVIKYFELLSLTDNINEWGEESFLKNEPRYYRFRQLKILFEAYSLGEFADFEKGEFIKQRPLEVYTELINMAKHFDKEILGSEIEYYKEKEHFNDYRTIKWLYNKLIGYRKVIAKAIHYIDGVSLESGLYMYTCDLIRHSNHTISKEIDIIDDVLSFLISPSGETFSVNELIVKYGFPDVNIEDIDLEWL
jgi:hypothetical protein